MKLLKALECLASTPKNLYGTTQTAQGCSVSSSRPRFFATQVSSLNDANETKYATDLYKEVVKELIVASAEDDEAVRFLSSVLDFVKEEPSSPTHGTSKFFVACFSGDEDELTQWDRYGKPNAYAIGFRARGLWREPTSQLYRVVYDRDRQLKAVKENCDGNITLLSRGSDRRAKRKAGGMGLRYFFMHGMNGSISSRHYPRTQSGGPKMSIAWSMSLKISDFSNVRFSQKRTMLGRYLALDTPAWVKRRSPLLPIAKIWIGTWQSPILYKDRRSTTLGADGLL